MNPGPQKPRVIRPPALPRPEVSRDCTPLAKKTPAGKISLLGSLGIHACLIAAAWSVTLNGSGEKTAAGDDAISQEAGDFKMIAPAGNPRPDEPDSSSRSLPLPAPATPPREVFAALLNSSAALILPPAEPWVLAPPDKQTGPSPATATATEKSSASPGARATNAGGRPRSGHGPLAKRESPAAPPKLLRAPPPRYPPEAKAAAKSGRVAVLIRVRANGSAASTSLYHSSGNRQLDQAAVDAARSWTFSPTPSLGSGNTFAVVVQVTFAL